MMMKKKNNIDSADVGLNLCPWCFSTTHHLLRGTLFFLGLDTPGYLHHCFLPCSLGFSVCPPDLISFTLPFSFLANNNI